MADILTGLFKIFLIILNLKSMTEMEKDIEIIALRSQLSIVRQQLENKKIPKAKPTPTFRLLWIFISKNFKNWKSALVIIKPETVIKWHKKAFKIYWKRKSKPGRPGISRKTIALIKRIHKENPLLSPEKIHEQLNALNVSDAPAPNTIEKYINGKNKKPPTDKQRQSWKTFLRNHRKSIWAIDLFVVPTLYFKVLYVFIVISHDRRKIEHFNVTANPCSSWVIQQMREATPFGYRPRYLVHDNDNVFVSEDFCSFLLSSDIKPVKTAFKSPWQNGVAERVIGTLRAELLNHIIPASESHLYELLKEYIEYYNNHRTHQGINCEIPVPMKGNPPETIMANTVLEAKPILGGLYHSYKKVA